MPSVLSSTDSAESLRAGRSSRSKTLLSHTVALCLSAGLFCALAPQVPAAPENSETSTPAKARGRRGTKSRSSSSSETPAKRPALARETASSTRSLALTTGTASTLPEPLASPPVLPSPDLETAAPATVLPPFPEETSTGELLARMDQALQDVGFGMPLDLDSSGLEESTATKLVEKVQNLLPNSPLPEKELDELTSTSRGAVRVSLMDMLCRSLSANQQLNVERLRPEISNTSIESALSEFDTTLDASANIRSRRSSTLSAQPRNGFEIERNEQTRVTRTQDVSVALSGRAPTGTNYSLGYGADRSSSNSTLPFFSSALNLNITQNLLKGAGCEVNLVRVRTAQNDFVRSLYTLQQFINNQITDAQTAYYNLYLAVETLRIRRQAYAVARQQREQVEQFVEVGRSAPLDALSAQAEEASRISDVINAAADLRRQQLEFLRIINPIGMRDGWRTRIFPLEPPLPPREPLVPEQHVKLAQRYRPELRQAEIDLANGELEVVRTENGLLPALDLVSELGTSGVGDTAGDANSDIFSGKFRNYRVGLQFSYPLQNRAARAADRRARFQRSQAQQAILNFQQVIEVDVRSAIIEIERTARLITSTAVTVRLREAELAAEIEKFRVGRSTQLLVNQAQRDLTNAQLQEVSARVAHIRAYLELYRADGTALQRRGIQPILINANSGVDNP